MASATSKTPTSKSKGTAVKKAKSAPELAEARPSVQQFRFGYLIHDVSRVRRTVLDDVMRPYGITRSQWSVLSALSRGGNDGMMQADLARLMEVGKVTVGGLVDRLEASGHIERRADQSDRRAKRVYITEQGYATIQLMLTIATEANQKILEGLTPKEVLMAEKVLYRVKLNLKALSESMSAEQKHEAPVVSSKKPRKI